MNFAFEIEKFNEFLNGLCTAANALRISYTGPEFDCYIEQLNFSKDKSFEDNFKAFFYQKCKKLNIKQPSNFQHHTDWIFEMESLNWTDAIHEFFYKNLFPTLNINQFSEIYQSLFNKIENLMGEIEFAKQGYISPPWQFNPYCQHWQHLYIHSNDIQLLITFEANT
ncbi:hypothetical protein [Acinetobacter piscicola]|uniref:hypothetical protein n=1 Tax=Acinetobacter piscicola TaxID=2006115 RepID=UPI00101F2843|nr:hypothetical protein [Acinetobacter piscicola]RYL26718.1 hypothetical protein EWP19_08970 [Acinetobacter piscicola]